MKQGSNVSIHVLCTTLEDRYNLFSILINCFSLQEVLHRPKNTLHFIRLHGPWPLLCRYAEELNLRAPIQVKKAIFPPFCAKTSGRTLPYFLFHKRWMLRILQILQFYKFQTAR
jgi:hypothetical protein